MSSFKAIAGLTLGFAIVAAGIEPAGNYIHTLKDARENAAKTFHDTGDSFAHLSNLAYENAPYKLPESGAAPAKIKFANLIENKKNLCNSDRIHLAGELDEFDPGKLQRDTQKTQLACKID